MTRCLPLLLLALGVPLAAHAGQKPLNLNLAAGLNAGYRVASEQITLSGDGKTVTEKVVNETPIQFQVKAIRGKNASVEITKGPLVVRGRSVGRARVTTEELAADGNVQGRAPTNFFVCLPPGGAKSGQTWRAPFFGGPPLPAGIQAVYTYRGATTDGRFAIVNMRVDHDGAGKLRGDGKLFLRLSDGLLDHGAAKFTISYLRPDPKDRNKITVNSQVVLKVTITAR